MTAYAILGAFVYFQLVVPIVAYWVRMAFRHNNTGLWTSTNMVDFANLVNWIFSLVVFLYPAIMFPLQWLDDALIDFLNAWYYVNLLADLIPIYYIAFFVMNIIILATSGKGSQQICDISDNCVFNNSY